MARTTTSRGMPVLVLMHPAHNAVSVSREFSRESANQVGSSTIIVIIASMRERGASPVNSAIVLWRGGASNLAWRGARDPCPRAADLSEQAARGHIPERIRAELVAAATDLARIPRTER
jgi:hypothetical protein